MTKLRQLQLKCLEMLDVVDRICKEHNINYSLCGGSVVGAHLYNGVLPWDDDIDLMMTRENYNQFLSIAEKELPKGYSIHNYQNSDLSTTLGFNYTKIFDDSTTFVQTNGKVMGIFIDITVYDKVPENILKYIDLFLYRRAMTINRGKLPGYSPKNIIRNFLLDTIFSNRRRYLKFAQRIIERIANRSSHYTYRELFGCFYNINMVPYSPSVFENYSTYKQDITEQTLENLKKCRSLLITNTSTLICLIKSTLEITHKRKKRPLRIFKNGREPISAVKYHCPGL